MPENVVVMGLGYVGLATALTLAHLGHQVQGFDIDVAKVNGLAKGKVPFHEQGLDDLLQEGLESGRLNFSTSAERTLVDADFVFICVGTPSLSTGQADLSQVHEAAQLIGQFMNGPLIVVNKSTVPVGTGGKVERWVFEAQHQALRFDVVSNPEFLREGSAAKDSLQPTRIVVGAERPEAATAVAKLFDGLVSPVLIYDRRTAEMVKYASNAFLATKISFINEIAAICDRVGADVTRVSEGMGFDPRIGGSFLQAGVGYGGSCFPKDTSALIQIAGDVYYDFKLLKAVVDVNNQSRLRVVQMLESALGGLSNKRVAVLGLSFKPNTDDVRESPALTVIPALLERGAEVVATDPRAIERAKSVLQAPTFVEIAVGNKYWDGVNDSNRHEYLVRFVEDANTASDGVDAVLLLTEWSEFLDLNWNQVASRMRGNVVVDGRNALDPISVKTAGLTYLCLGRPNHSHPYISS